MLYAYVSEVRPFKGTAFFVGLDEKRYVVPVEKANQFVAVVNGYLVCNRDEGSRTEYPVFPNFMAATVYATRVAATVEGQSRPTVEVMGISFGD